MSNVFEITDKIGRKIRLTDMQWKHISRKHPAVCQYFEEIKKTLENPDSITDTSPDENIKYYYKYYKYLKSPYKYIMVIVKYLNNHGFVISSYFEKTIK